MNHAVTEQPHTNGRVVVLLKSGRTIHLDHTNHHRATRGDRLAMVILFAGLALALLLFAFIRVGIPLIRHLTGGI